MGLFAPLPNPIAGVLSDIRPVDGLEVEPLLEFLGKVLHLKEFPGMEDSVVLELLVPLCLRPLGDKLLDCLKRGVNFDNFHSEVLELFVPFRVMERLKVERVFRPQKFDETLSQYVGDICGVWRVLRLGIPENQLVDIVLQGLKPEERSRLIFAPKPSSFADLDRLVILSRSVQDADCKREHVAGHLPRTGPHPAVASVCRGPETPQRQRHPIVCFGCGQTGHMRRECRQRVNLGTLSKNLSSSQGESLPKPPCEKAVLEKVSRNLVSLSTAPSGSAGFGEPLSRGMRELACMGVKAARSTCPRLNIFLGKTVQKALVDSGSARCLISLSLFENLKSSGLIKQVERSTHICWTASKSPLPIIYEALRSHPYKLAPPKMETLRGIINELLENGTSDEVPDGRLLLVAASGEVRPGRHYSFSVFGLLITLLLGPVSLHLLSTTMPPYAIFRMDHRRPPLHDQTLIDYIIQLTLLRLTQPGTVPAISTGLHCCISRIDNLS
ncbi:uncharacterized protein LOC128989016 [Macrosteles quadrilineatus]|uniref:uncharacterized protein LOC128989016 n=1 Tax=Macrosteles quadrilineatus TaxID=74068 RepID=UPI0023E3105E|nr:uncharacterized protein LOC128989016 [Macrosteles quadrilineatus]